MPRHQHGPLAGIRRVATRLRTRGLKDVLSLSIERGRENLWSSETLVLYVANSAPSQLDPGPAEVRLATSDDAVAYARDIGTDSAETFRARLDPETRCFVVAEGGKLLHSSWVTTGSAFTREIRGHLTPPPGDAYVYESFTRADARGRGIYPLALRSILTQVHHEGVPRLWVGVEDSNVPSRRAVAKAGFEEGFSLIYRRRFGLFTLDPPTGPLASEGEMFLR